MPTGPNPTLQDPYALAYRYKEYMEEKPKRFTERLNLSYENLLANQREPPENAMDGTSRAIRYAKEHYKCFYEKKDVKMSMELFRRRSNTKRSDSIMEASHI